MVEESRRRNQLKEERMIVLKASCHRRTFPRSYCAILAYPLNKQVSLTLKLLASLNENIGHLGSRLPTN